MSTVGSASATGSAGGRTTTWASSSQKGVTEPGDDEMSTDANFRDIDDRDRFSASAMDEDRDEDGMSDNTSLVGFGEGAGSTVSGPTYSRRDMAAGRSGLGSQGMSSGQGTPLGTEAAERIMRDRVDGEGGRPMGTPDEAGLGKFYFEEKK